MSDLIDNPMEKGEGGGDQITSVDIKEEMERSYLDYAMSVIVARALPDCRDGLKPGQRRILYAMAEAGYTQGKPPRKSARIVGDVMGKYHPHSGDAIYESMVRMAQDFSMRLPLVDGQGNFGSMDGDAAAAMRYTEARLASSASALLDDIDHDTVDFKDNYDGTHKEPEVLPAQFPHLLVNGAGGIAVGMATNIPPHNLNEVIDACCLVLDNDAVSLEEVMGTLKGPDFPTGGIIVGTEPIVTAYETGKGAITVRALCHIETHDKTKRGGRPTSSIIVKQIPYQVNKARLIEHIATLARQKHIHGISDLRDESDRDGVRVVIDIKRDSNATIVLNQLYQKTALQMSFGMNMLVLREGRPQMMPLLEHFRAFLAFRRHVVTRRTAFLLGKRRATAHALIGFHVALESIDDVIGMIRNAQNTEEAHHALCKKAWTTSSMLRGLLERVGEGERLDKDGTTYHLSSRQAKAILELRLHRLTALERHKIKDDLEKAADDIDMYLLILNDKNRLDNVVRQEMESVKERFGHERITRISGHVEPLEEKDLVQSEDIVITLSHKNYIKRVPRASFRAQKRGGKGRSGMKVGEEDTVVNVWDANTRMNVLFFSNKGMVYQLEAHQLPEGTPQSKGRSLMNVLPLAQGERITSLMVLPEDEKQWNDKDIFFATAQGMVRRNHMSDFSHLMARGKIAMKLREGDSLVGVSLCDNSQDVFLATKKGQCIRFAVSRIRVFTGRMSSGVSGMKLGQGDGVVSLSMLRHGGDTDSHEELILTMTDTGLGKCSSSRDYREANRGGKGIINIALEDKDTACVVASYVVSKDDDIILMGEQGTCLRMSMKDVRIAGRATRGVRLLKMAQDERIVSAAVMAYNDAPSSSSQEAGL